MISTAVPPADRPTSGESAAASVALSSGIRTAKPTTGRRRWRVAYSCASLAGQHAAVRAGLGATVLPKDMVPAGLVTIERRSGLPDLYETEIALLAARGLPAPERGLTAGGGLPALTCD